MDITNNLKQKVAVGLVGLLTTLSLYGGLYAGLAISNGVGYFEGHVYKFAKTDVEIQQKEKEFLEKTGFDVRNMSILDKYFYANAVRRGYVK